MANPALASAAPSAPPRPRTTRRTSAPPRTRTARRTSAQAKARTRRSTSAQAKTGPRPRNRSRPRTKRPASARRVVQPAFAGAAAGAAMLPGAALRSAVAVRDLSDSGLILRLTRGRGWIAVLSVLLFGIVALNVVSLSLNAGSGRVSQAVEELERQNSGLRAQLAEQLSASQIQGAAAIQGFAVPAPEDISYLTTDDGDLERLIKLLNEETLLTSEPAEIDSSSEPVSYLPPVSQASSPAPATAPAQAAPPPAPSSGGSTGSAGSG